MKTLAVAAVAAFAFAGSALAESHSVSEFRIGILGGENAQDRLNSYQCLADKTSELLGVETKLLPRPTIMA